MNTAWLMEMFTPLVREWERKKERLAAMTFTLNYNKYIMLVIRYNLKITVLMFVVYSYISFYDKWNVFLVGLF